MIYDSAGATLTGYIHGPTLEYWGKSFWCGLASGFKDKCEARFIPLENAKITKLDAQDIARVVKDMTADDVVSTFGTCGGNGDSPYRIYLHKGCPGDCYWFWFGTPPEKPATGPKVLRLIALQKEDSAKDTIVWPREREGEKPGTLMELARQYER
jgi:hypothetical protein